MFRWLGKELVVPETNGGWLLTGVDQLGGRHLLGRERREGEGEGEGGDRGEGGEI